MNNSIYLFLIALTLPFLATTAAAQQPVPNEPALVNQYIFDYSKIRNPSWWDALESQLVLMIDKPHDQIDEKSIQNIIFFASNHKDKVDLNAAVPILLDLYRYHEVDGMRVLSAVALHAIGDRYGMKRLNRYARLQPKGPAKRIAQLVLADYYKYTAG